MGGIKGCRNVPRFRRVVVTYKGVLNLRNLISNAQTVSRIPCKHFVLCKVASKTTHFHS